MKKAIMLWSLILLSIAILPLLVCAVSAEPIIIDTEKGVPGFRTEPARDLPANWQYVHDHPDTSADGWFDTNAYPPGQGNGSFWYTISFPDMDECKGIWETSVPYTGKYEVFVWIPSPDSFDPYLDESTPPSDYLPTKRAQYKVFHNDGVATITIDQNVNMGRFTSLGVFVFDTTARVVLSSNGVEFWRCVAFDAVTFVPVVHDMAVTDVFIMPPTTSVWQSTVICVRVTNEGSQQEENVSVKAFVDGAQVGSTKYVSLDPGVSDTMTFLWIPSAAKNYSVEGEVGVVNGEMDTEDNTRTVEVRVSATTTPATILSEATTWPSDPTVNVPICTVSGCSPQMVSDEAGGAIITWYEYDGGPSTIYAQRIDYSGNVLWQQNGKPICTVSIANYPTIVSDGSGGAIITWPDRQGRNIYAQHIDSNGNVLWPQPGVLLSEQGGCLAKIASDGYGGALIVWENLHNDPYAQRVDFNGNVLWQQDGVLISTNGRVLESQIVSDGSGGAIITWPGHQGRNVYAQRVDSNGNTVWQPSVPICTADNWRGYPKILQDSSGGAIIAWRDSRSGEGEDLYAQRVDSNGNVLWTTDGVPICTAEGQQAVSHLISDGSGGAIITWNDCRINESDVYAQRVDSGGNILWQQDGVPICTAEKAQWDPKMVSDDHGGAIIAWEDWRSETGETLEDADIYAQRVDSNGNVLWQQNGVPICTAEKAQWQPKIVSNDYGGAIITWKDYRNGQNWGIYAQNVNLDGTLGVGGPNLFVAVTKTKFPAGEIADVALILEDANGNPVTGLPEIEYRIDSESWKQESVKSIEPGVYTFAIQFPSVPGEHTLFVNANVGGRIVSGSDSFFVNYGSEKIPVVLVHGFQSEDSYDPKVIWGTMKEDLTNNDFTVYVSHYANDYVTALSIEQYAGNLGREIDRIKREHGADKVDIVAHDMGGLVARRYIEMCGGDEDVRKLIMLETPNQGCNEKVLPLILAGSSFQVEERIENVLTMITFGTHDMPLPPNLQAVLFLIGLCVDITSRFGTWFGTSIGMMESWNSVKEMRSNHEFLNSLNQNYVNYIGEVHYTTLGGWLFEIPWLKTFDLEGVSKETISGISDPIAGWHGNLPKNEKVIQRVKEILSDDPDGNSGIYMSEDNAELQYLPSITGKISPSEQKLHEIPIGSATVVNFILVWSEGDLNLTLTTPNGTLIDPSFAANDTNVTYYSDENLTIEGYIIKNPESRVWNANVTAVNISTEENYTIMTFLETNITLSLSFQKYRYDPNELVNISANLMNGGEAITNASVIAKIKRPDNVTENITLYDDGSHNDNQTDDGIYANTYMNTSLWGTYDITVTANGTVNGKEFARQTVAPLWVEQPPDLVVKDISFSNNTPSVGDNITINATIENIGNGNATNATIEFYVDDPINGTLIGNGTIDIESNSSKIVSMDWVAEYGNYKIYAVVPASNPFLEENYTNNMAFNSINVTGPVITLSLTMPVEVNLNNTFVAEALIENSGTELIGANATIILPSSLLTSEPLTITLGNIEGNKTVNWNITANQTGLYEIGVNLASENSEDYASRKNISVFHILLGDLPTNLTCYQGANVTIDIPITNFNPNVSYVGLYINTSVRDPSDNFYRSINNISLLRAGETETSEFVWNQTEKQGIYEVNVSLFMGLTLVSNKRTQFEVVNATKPPIANFTYSPLHPVVNQTITFNASNSTDPDGFITEYNWDFGDGNITNTTEPIITHSYALAGEYTVNLTVTDNDGAKNTTLKMITVNPSGPPTIIYPDFTDTDTPGNWRTWIGVMNTGDASTKLNLTIYNQDGSLAYSNPDFVTLEPNAAHFFRPGITAGIAQGSTIVSGNTLAGTCHESKNDGDGAKVYTAVTGSSQTLYYPDFTDTDTIGNWRTWMGVVNAGDTSTTVRLDVYNPDGSLAYSNPNFVTLEPKAAHFFRPGITAGIAQGCVVVSGANLAGTCHVNKNGGEGTKVYTALTRGSSTLYYPDFTDTDTIGNWRTWLGVMNTGDASTTLNLTIYNPDGSLAYSNANFITLEPKAAHFFRPGITAGIAQGCVVVSGDNLAGTCHVNKNGGEGTKAYTALSSGSSTLNYPDFTDTDIPGNWRTWLGVMNTGATSTTVRLDVYNADGSLAYSNANFVTLEPKATHFFRPGITAGIAQGDVVVSGDSLAGTCHVNKNGGVGTKVYTAVGG